MSACLFTLLLLLIAAASRVLACYNRCCLLLLASIPPLPWLLTGSPLLWLKDKCLPLTALPTGDACCGSRWCHVLALLLLLSWQIGRVSLFVNVNLIYPIQINYNTMWVLYELSNTSLWIFCLSLFGHKYCHKYFCEKNCNIIAVLNEPSQSGYNCLQFGFTGSLETNFNCCCDPFPFHLVLLKRSVITRSVENAIMLQTANYFF